MLLDIILKRFGTTETISSHNNPHVIENIKAMENGNTLTINNKSYVIESKVYLEEKILVYVKNKLR